MHANQQQAPVEQTSKARNGAIDFLKFLFALLIVVLHSRNFATGPGALFPGGSIAVEFFFVVSGFLMAQSAKRIHLTDDFSTGPATARFIGRKIKGFLPHIYVAWVIAFFVKNFFSFESIATVFKRGLFSLFELLFVTHSGLMVFRANAATWYISAMLLAMALLYPLLIKNRKLFLYLIAPLISIFLLGWMLQSWEDGFVGPSRWLGFAHKGVVRAVGEIALGCVCYQLCTQLKRLTPTKLFSILLGIAEVGCYAFVVTYAFFRGHSSMDFVLLLILAVGITITFSQNSITASWFKSPVFPWLGMFSFDLFLSHGYWSNVMLDMFPNLTYRQIFPIYLLISFATALFVWLVSRVISKHWKTFTGFLKRKLVVS